MLMLIICKYIFTLDCVYIVYCALIFTNLESKHNQLLIELFSQKKKKTLVELHISFLGFFVPTCILVQ